MGRMFTESVLGIDLEVAIGMHLRSNHYPPVPLSMVEPCMDAIDAAWNGDWNQEIFMPDGISYKGKDHAPAWAIIEQHHLDPWLEGIEE